MESTGTSTNQCPSLIQIPRRIRPPRCLAFLAAAVLATGCGSEPESAEKAGPAAEVVAERGADPFNDAAPDAPRPDDQSDSSEPSTDTGSPATAVEAFEHLVLLRSLEADFVSVNDIAFSPDGKTLVTGGGTPSIWQVGNDEPLHVLDGLYPATGTIVEADALAISPDGTLLAMGGGDGVLLLIRIEPLELLHEIEAHEEGILSVAFSGDGKTVASSGFDGQARLWNSATGEAISSWKVEEDQGFMLDLSTDGKTVVSAGTDALIWSAEKGENLGCLNLGDERLIQVMNVAFSPDGKQIATAEATADLENAALIWSTETRKITGKLKHNLGVRSISFSSDGLLLATSSVDVKTRIWRIADEKLLQTIEIDEMESNLVESLAWMPGGKVLAIATGGTIFFWGPEGALPASESAADDAGASSMIDDEEMEAEEAEREPEVVGSEGEEPPA